MAAYQPTGICRWHTRQQHTRQLDGSHVTPGECTAYLFTYKNITYLLFTCYLNNDGRRSSLNAQISPPVQSVFERFNRSSVDNFLSQVVPVARYSVAKEKFSCVESTSVDY